MSVERLARRQDVGKWGDGKECKVRERAAACVLRSTVCERRLACRTAIAAASTAQRTNPSAADDVRKLRLRLHPRAACRVRSEIDRRRLQTFKTPFLSFFECRIKRILCK